MNTPATIRLRISFYFDCGRETGFCFLAGPLIAVLTFPCSGDSVAFTPLEGVQVVIDAEVESPAALDFEVSGTIVLLRERFEAVRRSEIHRVRGRLGNLSPDQEDVVESLSRGIIERVLQAPVAMLLSTAAANQCGFIVETVRRVFNLRT